QCFFFFSSRRRHTRFSRDWSSDVCSSDLTSCRSACSNWCSSMAPSGDSRTLQSGRKASAPAHRSIGEVLALLKDEFPDITISKIRFLESQGLLDPERTPSGYRRFYDKDVERLRWILRQQRE